ncbi:hypothetical protein SKAU_G00419880 [Synaphobranchus kaupii]|uniref:Uncharacterized protein n=1 Tax=Synaphobranchus kaupii TaxID=118154 RepID=A0A9Q1IB12_SYNKA|nr:hypothetical protein SKAU_G00419880 [Synaphobranchus kaupii]
MGRLVAARAGGLICQAMRRETRAQVADRRTEREHERGAVIISGRALVRPRWLGGVGTPRRHPPASRPGVRGGAGGNHRPPSLAPVCARHDRYRRISCPFAEVTGVRLINYFCPAQLQVSFWHGPGRRCDLFSPPPCPVLSPSPSPVSRPRPHLSLILFWLHHEE